MVRDLRISDYSTQRVLMQKKNLSSVQAFLQNPFKRNNMVMHRLSMGVVMILVIMQTSCAAQSLTWAERMASSVMYTYPDSIVVKKYTTHGPSEEKLDKKPERPASWNYELGVVLKGFEKLWQQSGDK